MKNLALIAGGMMLVGASAASAQHPMPSPHSSHHSATGTHMAGAGCCCGEQMHQMMGMMQQMMNMHDGMMKHEGMMKPEGMSMPVPGDAGPKQPPTDQHPH